MKKTAKLLISAFCAVVLMVSLFALPVFAAEGDGSAAKSNDYTALIVWSIVGGVVLIAAVVLCIKFRTKIAKGLRVYKSEFKKVSWLSWEQTRKSTLVVLGVLVIFAAVICLMDLGLAAGIKWLIIEAFAG